MRSDPERLTSSGVRSLAYGSGSSPFPQQLRADLEQICGGAEIRAACGAHQASPGARLLDDCVEQELARRGYRAERNVRAVGTSRFDIDLLVDHPEWRAAIAVEGGQAARVDLDLLKLIAFARSNRTTKPLYAALVASNKPLLRTITGTVGETVLDYAKRLRPLFAAAAVDVADLLVVEFEAGPSHSGRARD